MTRPFFNTFNKGCQDLQDLQNLCSVSKTTIPCGNSPFIILWRFYHVTYTQCSCRAQRRHEHKSQQCKSSRWRWHSYMSHAPPPLMMLREIRSWRDIKVDSDIGDDVDEDACVNFVSKLGCLLTTFGRGVPFGRVSNLGGCQTNSAGCHTPQNRTDCDIFNFLPIISHNNNLTTPSSSLAMYGNRHLGCSLYLNPSTMVIIMPSCHN